MSRSLIRMPRPMPGFMLCHVCGDLHPHAHITGFICVTCRALDTDALVAKTRETTLHLHKYHRRYGRKAREPFTDWEYKRCNACWQMKSFEDYDKSTTRADRAQAECKACRKLRRALRADPAAWVRVRDALRQSAAHIVT